MPFADTDTVVGELEASLTNETVPVRFVAVWGAKVTLNAALWPGSTVTGSVSPVMLNPDPEAVAWDSVRLAAPVLLMATAWVLVQPDGTVPKLMLVGFGVSWPEPPLPVREIA